MSLEEAVVLVEHAFAASGDLFIRKAPACTVLDLATAVAELLGVEPDIKVIGTKHGEIDTKGSRHERNCQA